MQPKTPQRRSNFRRANRINPNLDNVRDAIQSLERMLGEEGKR